MSDDSLERYEASFARSRSGQGRDEADPQEGSPHDTGRKHYKERRREEEEGDEEEEDDEDEDGDDDEGDDDDDDEGAHRGGKRQKVSSRPACGFHPRH
jgi:hypothetical protein